MTIDPIMSWHAVEHPASGGHSYGEHSAAEIAAHVAALRHPHRLRVRVAGLARSLTSHLHLHARPRRVELPPRQATPLAR